MQDYKEYLAIHVLNESETVNYRMLSRALKIHGNRAKQCLFDFHSRQAQKKPNSVSATYLITGRRQISQSNDVSSQPNNDDIALPSSPFPSSSAPEPTQDDTPPTWTRVVLLAKEADLDSAKASLDEISAVHIYSLSPSAPNDLQTLGECTRRVRTAYATEDPLEQWAQYGVIQNDKVWRRTRKGQPVPPPAVVAAPSKAPLTAANPSPPPSSAESKPAAAAVKPEPPAAKKPPALKPSRSSIMSSFARTAAPKKPAPAPEAEADTAPALSDEDLDPDDGDDGMDLDAGGADAAAAAGGKTKEQRAAELRDMMELDSPEADDAAMPDAAEEAEEEEEEAALDGPAPEAAKAEPEPEPESRAENGRRRGRRRVMKKKTVKDEEGYLVTKEEAVWESFSEDEAPAAKKAKPAFGGGEGKSATAKKTAAATAAKKQGGIMSFFAKK